MLKKFFSTVIASALVLTGLTFTSSPAQAVGTGDTGSIYYFGAWNGPNWTGLRRLDLATGDDIRLNIDTPTCTGLMMGATSGLAVDIAHKRIYWTTIDGNPGVYAMDLAIGKCYTLESGTSPRGIAVSNNGNTVTWGVRVYNPNTQLFGQELHTIQVADLESLVANNASPGSLPVEIPGFSDIAISDLEMHNGRLYALMNATEDANLAAHNFIYSFDPDDLSIPAVLESDTGVIGSPQQFQIGASAFFVSTFDQIYKIDFGSPGASWGMMLNQISGFALVGDNLYSAFNRDEPMKIFNPNVDTEPRAIAGNPAPDMYSYLVYADPIVPPTITAQSGDSLNGTVSVPFSGVTVGNNEVIGYSITPRDGSAPFGGFCTLSGNSCQISGLDDAKIYDVTLRLAYTYQDPNDQANPTKVIVSSAPSNSVQINHEVVNPPAPTAKKTLKTFTGFTFEKGTLNASTKRAIRVWLNGKSGYNKVTCVGYTGFNYNKRSVAYLRKLALQRATNVCNYIHSIAPNIVVKSKTAKLDTSKQSATRRVIATITN
ncbi:MAG: hypothetical protein RLZZ514_1254 [Actinomycetota bacterium]